MANKDTKEFKTIYTEPDTGIDTDVDIVPGQDTKTVVVIMDIGRERIQRTIPLKDGKIYIKVG